MSGFMFGGSALTLDVGVTNNTGFAVNQGDVLQIALAVAADDGLLAEECASGTGDINIFSVTGVVLAPTGLNIAQGENCIIRVVGPAKAKCVTSAAYVVGQGMKPTDGLTPAAGTPLTFDASAAPNSAAADLSAGNMLAKAVCLEAVGSATAGQLIDVWMKGLPL